MLVAQCGHFKDDRENEESFSRFYWLLASSRLIPDLVVLFFYGEKISKALKTQSYV